MRIIISALIFVIFVGCTQKEGPKIETQVVPVGVTDSASAEPQATNATPEKVTDTAAAVPTPAAPKKIDYDAINKGILQDVSKKIVDKASKKD